MEQLTGDQMVTMVQWVAGAAAVAVAAWSMFKYQ